MNPSLVLSTLLRKYKDTQHAPHLPYRWHLLLLTLLGNQVLHCSPSFVSGCRSEETKWQRGTEHGSHFRPIPPPLQRQHHFFCSLCITENNHQGDGSEGKDGYCVLCWREIGQLPVLSLLFFLPVKKEALSSEQSDWYPSLFSLVPLRGVMQHSTHWEYQVRVERLYYLCIWHLCDHCWNTASPRFKDVEKLEWVQRRATRIIQGWENMPDRDRHSISIYLTWQWED